MNIAASDPKQQKPAAIANSCVLLRWTITLTEYVILALYMSKINKSVAKQVQIVDS